MSQQQMNEPEAELEVMRSRVVRAERMEKGIRNEAEGYRQDHIKLILWLCDNGFGKSCKNSADTVIILLDLLKQNTELLRTIICAFPLAVPERLRLQFAENCAKIEEEKKCL